MKPLLVLIFGLWCAACFALLLAVHVHPNAGIVWFGGVVFGVALARLAGRARGWFGDPS